MTEVSDKLSFLKDLDYPAKVLATEDMKNIGVLFRAHPHNAIK